MLLQVLDCDYIENNGKPVIRIFCKNERGETICCFYENFLPYFYVSGDEEKIVDFLKNNEDVVKIEKVKRKRAIGYTTKTMNVLKVTLRSPKQVRRFREELENKPFVTSVYEADILFRYRFMIDHEIGGMRWMEVDGKPAPTSVVKCKAISLERLKPAEREDNAPLKIMSLDIECLPEDTEKPLTEDDKIIMISLAFSPPYKGSESITLVAKHFRNKQKDVITVSSEKELLEKFLEIIDSYDPDIITGYNVQSFDLPHILARLKKNKLRATFGRCAFKPVTARKVNENYECTVPGRVVVDPYLILKRDPWMRFKRYDLNTVAKELLNEEKIDIKYRDMPEYWNGDESKLQKFIEYVKKDAVLALRLVIEKRMLDKFFELSKISGLLLQDVFGGQSKRVENRILYEFKRRGILMPCKPNEKEAARRKKEREEHGLKGAIVLEPKKGLHTEGCTIVLDFASLYPNLIRTYNISPDTLITDEEAERVIEAPNGARFVDSKIYRGVLPAVLDDLIEKRLRIKKLAKQATGEKKHLLTAMQLALKDMANSMYGYTGYLLARLYVLDVANAITAFGRENLKLTRRMIEEKYGYKVIYADTDSVFLETKITSFDEAKRVGEEICKYVSEKLPGTLELDFDKIFRTFLILTKKRYAGWCFSLENGQWKDEIVTKGIETVRRDWCEIVSETQQKVLELLLKKGDVKGATRYVREVIEKIKRNEIPLEKLTIIKSITKSLDSYDGVLPHIELAKKLAKREPSNAPKVGDRIGFVIVAGNAMLSKRAEDPEYVREHHLQLDWNYYLTNQILPAIERIMQAIGVTRTELLGGGHQIKISDVFSGNAAQRPIEVRVENKNPVLEGWEEFLCTKCKRSYRRVPLSGMCDCRGELVICFQGNVGKKCAQ